MRHLNKFLIYSLLFFITLIVCPNAQSNNTKKVVVVLDTGMPETGGYNECDTGHRDFTNTNIKDYVGHATNIAGLIIDQVPKQYLAGYCLVFVKYFNPINTNIIYTINALEYLVSYKNSISILVYAGGGEGSNYREKALVQELLDAGVIVVAAAGNHGNNLDEKPFYPASYDRRIMVAGCINLQKTNFGSDVDIELDCVNKGYPIMSGTSQATAILAGMLLHELLLREE